MNDGSFAIQYIIGEPSGLSCNGTKCIKKHSQEPAITKCILIHML